MDTTKHAEQIIWLAGKRHVICVGGRVALMGVHLTENNGRCRPFPLLLVSSIKL